MLCILLRGLSTWPWDDDPLYFFNCLLGAERYEAHIQATESEALKQTRFPGAYENSRWAKNACEEAGPGARPPRGEDRVEVIRL